MHLGHSGRAQRDAESRGRRTRHLPLEFGFGPEFTLGPAFGRTPGGRPGMTERVNDSQIHESGCQELGVNA
jgi:hypothetical protein